MLEAIVFDFDGLILDTETLLYDVWREVFEEWGLEPITVEEWCRSLGRDDTDPARIDPRLLLRDQLGSAVDLVGLDERRRRRRDELLELVPLQPGVEEVLALASTRGLAVAIASSSPVDWVERHLSNHGLLSSFSVLACAASGRPGKPHPATYLHACASLGVDPARSLALEDSPHGITAAKAAGLHAIAVPTALTAGQSFDLADHRLESLQDLRLVAIGGDAVRAVCGHC